MIDQFRPRRTDIEDREVYITLNSETAFRAINTAGNPQLIGRARVGTDEGDAKWQLMQLVYDAAGSITAIRWPINQYGKPSNAYKFVWGPTTAVAITGIDRGATTKVYASNSFAAGDKVYLDGILGTTGLNYDGTNLYSVASADVNAFYIAVNSSGMNAYTSGGQAHKSTALQNGFA